MRKHQVIYKKERFTPSRWKDLYGEHLRPYAYRNFKGFVAVLYYLLVKEGKSFDLLVGGGNSGSGIVSLAELVYKRLKQPIPTTLRIPIQRYKKPGIIWSDDSKDYYDNRVLLGDIQSQLKDTDVRSVLYVDDETSGVGLTVKTALQLIQEFVGSKQLKYTIVTEDAYKLRWNNTKSIQIDSYSFSRATPELFSVLFYVLPWKIEKSMTEQIGKEIDVKSLVCILLDAPLREKVAGKPKFGYELHKLAKVKISNLEELKKEFISHLNSLIEEGVKEYKNGEISIK